MPRNRSGLRDLEVLSKKIPGQACLSGDLIIDT